MNVVTPALNGIDMDINGAAFCTFFCRVAPYRQTDITKLIVALSNFDIYMAKNYFIIV
jgi:hypothetical protein